MAIIAKAIEDGHFYIRTSQSKGTRQITDAGLNWLRKNGQQMPSTGESVDLPSGYYRYLEDNNYLYIGNIDYKKHIAQYLECLAPFSPTMAQDGPPLLLCVHGYNAAGDNTQVHWSLHLKVDELDEPGREALCGKKDVSAIGSRADPSSMIKLSLLRSTRHWPEIAPQTEAYAIYWRTNSGGFFRLKEAIPTAGLLDNWQGNVFRTCEQPELIQYWRRFHANSSISLENNQAHYWLARTGKKPEWPGDEQKIGQSQNGWQLWRLQFKKEELLTDNSLVEFERWFSYRDIHLNYPRWRVHLLNPLYSSTEAYHYEVPQGQPLLFACIPPTNPGGNALLTAKSSYQQQHSHAPLGNGATNYLRFQVPRDPQEYRFNVSGEAARQLLHIQVAPQVPRLPDWLDGFQCRLKMADKHHSLYAFTSEPSQHHACTLFQVSEHFTLAELALLTWDWSPAELHCSGCYVYLSPQGEDCYESIPSGTTASTLTMWWQNSIWDKVRDSSWVKLTLDAGSFGHIMVKFQLKPEVLDKPDEVLQLESWWTNKETVTALLWLSQSAQPMHKGITYPLLPAMQITLKQLCRPDMPTHITAALRRLSSYKNIDSWASVRLQTLLAEIRLKSPIITKK